MALACGSSGATMVETYGVSFKSGRPQVGETLESALAEPVAEEFARLEFDIRWVKEFPAKLEVHGFTDDRECRGKDCIALSQRRAKLVYDWLIAHGMPADRLALGNGHGSAMPIDDNTKSEGRARNRRVEVQIAGFDK